MDRMPEEERHEFPAVGARARSFRRFERDLEAWLATAEGRFAVWSARAAIDAREYAAERSGGR
jgi:hypothetical protein